MDPHTACDTRLIECLRSHGETKILRTTRSSTPLHSTHPNMYSFIPEDIRRYRMESFAFACSRFSLIVFCFFTQLTTRGITSLSRRNNWSSNAIVNARWAEEQRKAACVWPAMRTQCYLLFSGRRCQFYLLSRSAVTHSIAIEMAARLAWHGRRQLRLARTRKTSERSIVVRSASDHNN